MEQNRRITVYQQYGDKPLADLPENRLQFMQRCLEYRIQGVDYNRMAQLMASDYTSCRKAVKEALAQSVSELAEEVRTIEMQRLDELIVAHWPSRDVPRNADVILKIMDRRSKFLGLDTPQTDLTDAAQALREFIAAAMKNTGADATSDE